MGKVKVQKNPFDLALYISLFPQLIAGPIVRYETIADQIQNRKESKELISKGFYRFVIGLGKKVLLANKMAVIADNVFGIDVSLLSTSYAWLGAIAYSIQIYFDFSGYSDMAIGLGQIFGFTFEENFNYPYMAKSVTDFWRRWHISLSTWFKDYVYIPLGGNRCSKIRNYFNLFVVWAFTGIWHGANWTFWLWGIYYFLLLVIEKTLKLNELKSPIILFVYRIFTLLLIILGWVLFRSETILYALEFIKKLFMFETDFTAFIYTIKNGWFIIIISLICCFPVSKFFESTRYNNCFIYVKSFLILIVFSLCIFSVISSTYNPFIYFNF